MWRERYKLKIELLNLKEPAYSCCKSEKACSKETLRVWLSHHLVKSLWLWWSAIFAKARDRDGIIPANTLPVGIKRGGSNRTHWWKAVGLLGFYKTGHRALLLRKELFLKKRINDAQGNSRIVRTATPTTTPRNTASSPSVSVSKHGSASLVLVGHMGLKDRTMKPGLFRCLKM